MYVCISLYLYIYIDSYSVYIEVVSRVPAHSEPGCVCDVLCCELGVASHHHDPVALLAQRGHRLWHLVLVWVLHCSRLNKK